MAATAKSDTISETPALDAGERTPDPTVPDDAAQVATFAVRDYVTYAGPLGTYSGRVAEVDGPRHFVDLVGVGRVLCGAADLTADEDALLNAAGAIDNS